MYARDELVVRANDGIFRISEIGHPDFQSPKESRLYYTLIPVGDIKTRIFVPVAPEPAGIRRLISKDEAWELIQQIPDIMPFQIENEKQREQQYRQALRSNDPRQVAAVIKTLYARDCARLVQGRKSPAMDQNYFQRAEKILYSELAVVLGVEECNVPELIRAAIAKKNPNETA